VSSKAPFVGSPGALALPPSKFNRHTARRRTEVSDVAMIRPSHGLDLRHSPVRETKSQKPYYSSPLLSKDPCSPLNSQERSVAATRSWHMSHVPSRQGNSGAEQNCVLFGVCYGRVEPAEPRGTPQGPAENRPSAGRWAPGGCGGLLPPPPPGRGGRRTRPATQGRPATSRRRGFISPADGQGNARGDRQALPSLTRPTTPPSRPLAFPFPSPCSSGLAPSASPLPSLGSLGCLDKCGVARAPRRSREPTTCVACRNLHLIFN